MTQLPWYCTREDVKSALDYKETARNNRQIDRAIDAGSRAVEDLTNRQFYPDVTVRYFDWPNAQFSRSWRLWLDKYELISVSQLSNRGGSIILPTQYFLEPVDGPPFTRIELDISVQSGSYAFGGASTFQRAIQVNGTFGYRDDRLPAGTVATTASAGASTLDVSDSSEVGVGTLLIGTLERMFVSGRQFIATAATLGANLTASMANNAVTVSNGALVTQGEVIMIDAEKMLVAEIAGNVLSVLRAWDGSTLAAHTGALALYAPRRLTVVRAMNGTTAVSQVGGVALERQTYPGLVHELAIAESIVLLTQESAAYGRTVGAGDNARESSGKGLDDLRQRITTALGKQMRVATV